MKKIGKWLVALLDFLDKDHCEKTLFKEVEKSKNIEFGYKWFIPRGLYSVSLFHYDVKDKIVSSNGKFINLDNAVDAAICEGTNRSTKLFLILSLNSPKGTL